MSYSNFKVTLYHTILYYSSQCLTTIDFLKKTRRKTSWSWGSSIFKDLKITFKFLQTEISNTVLQKTAYDLKEFQSTIKFIQGNSPHLPRDTYWPSFEVPTDPPLRYPLTPFWGTHWPPSKKPRNILQWSFINQDPPRTKTRRRRTPPILRAEPTPQLKITKKSFTKL